MVVVSDFQVVFHANFVLFLGFKNNPKSRWNVGEKEGGENPIPLLWWIGTRQTYQRMTTDQDKIGNEEKMLARASMPANETLG